jgi:hypothetical protein
MKSRIASLGVLGLLVSGCVLVGEEQDPSTFMTMGNADSQEAGTSGESDTGGGDGDGDPGDGDGDTGDGDGDGDGDPGPVCGDGVIDLSEECDGNNLGGATCVGEGFSGGTLGCTPACTLDTSACSNAGEGAPCTFDNDCPVDFACVDDQCFDGSEGDPCVFDSDCGGGNYCDTDQCWDGTVGDACLSDGDCLSDICLIAENFCSEGNPGDPCTFTNECQNSCSSNVCT